MKNVGGPKNPGPTTRVVGGKLVPLRADSAGKAEKVEPAAVLDGFDKVQTSGIVVPEQPGTTDRGAQLRARLAAKGTMPIKDVRSDQVRMRDGSGGKIVEGSLTIESAKGLLKLEGVVRISGDLTLQEMRLSGADVTPVNTLVEIGGRLTIEGVSS